MLKKCHDHLETVHENYVQHLIFAISFGFRLFYAGIAVILHGIFPAIFQTTGSRTIFALYDELKARQDHSHHHE